MMMRCLPIVNDKPDIRFGMSLAELIKLAQLVRFGIFN